jgi:hypothetical protein
MDPRTLRQSASRLGLVSASQLLRCAPRVLTPQPAAYVRTTTFKWCCSLIVIRERTSDYLARNVGALTCSGRTRTSVEKAEESTRKDHI